MTRRNTSRRLISPFKLRGLVTRHSDQTAEAIHVRFGVPARCQFEIVDESARRIRSLLFYEATGLTGFPAGADFSSRKRILRSATLAALQPLPTADAQPTFLEVSRAHGYSLICDPSAARRFRFHSVRANKISLEMVPSYDRRLAGKGLQELVPWSQI